MPASVAMLELRALPARAGGEARMEVGDEAGERHVAEAGQQQRLGIAKGGVEGRVDGLLDEAAGRLRPVADRQQRGTAEGVVDVAQRDLRRLRVSTQPPPWPFSEPT